jgi:hypothetical protein
MDHDEYLNDLALYAAGVLTPADSERVRRHVATCAACQRELGDLRQSLAGLTEAMVEPDWSGHRELRQAFQERLESAGTPPPRPHPARRARGLVAAWAATLLVAAWGWATAWQAHQQATHLHQVVALMTHAPRIALQPATGVRGVVDLYLATREAVVVVRRLPPPGPGHVYEGWWIVGSRPLPAGTFGSGPSLLRRPPGARAFAITIEPAGGTRRPTTPILAETSV